MIISYLKKFLSILLVFFFFNFFQFGNSKKCISSSFQVLCFRTEQNWNAPDSLQKKNKRIIHDVYRLPLREQHGKKIWIVDGLVIRREIFHEFLYGGNDERYLFVPKNEIWIDHAIAAELRERELLEKGWKYDDAYSEAMKVVSAMRKKSEYAARKHLPLIIQAKLVREVGTGKEE